MFNIEVELIEVNGTVGWHAEVKSDELNESIPSAAGIYLHRVLGSLAHDIVNAAGGAAQ